MFENIRKYFTSRTTPSKNTETVEEPEEDEGFTPQTYTFQDAYRFADGHTPEEVLEDWISALEKNDINVVSAETEPFINQDDMDAFFEEEELLEEVIQEELEAAATSGYSIYRWGSTRYDIGFGEYDIREKPEMATWKVMRILEKMPKTSVLKVQKANPAPDDTTHIREMKNAELIQRAAEYRATVYETRQYWGRYVLRVTVEATEQGQDVKEAVHQLNKHTINNDSRTKDSIDKSVTNRKCQMEVRRKVGEVVGEIDRLCEQIRENKTVESDLYYSPDGASETYQKIELE